VPFDLNPTNSKERGKKGLTGEDSSGEGAQRVDDGVSPAVYGVKEVVDRVEMDTGSSNVRSASSISSRRAAEGRLEMRRPSVTFGWRPCTLFRCGFLNKNCIN
jgi:hypothetical protein